MSSALAGKTALVTGASRGIGLAIAEALAEAGCAVLMTARSVPALRKIEKKYQARGLRVRAIGCDIRLEKEVGKLFAAMKRGFGNLDIFVNNAGVAGPTARIEETQTDDWRDVMGTNLDGLFFCTRAALPLMNDGGVIVNNLSIAAQQPFAGMGAYVAAKHGALGFTKVLREQVRERGIRVVALLPGAVDTEIWQQFWPEAPRKKMISARAVAEAVVYAVSQPAGVAINELHIGPVAGTL